MFVYLLFLSSNRQEHDLEFRLDPRAEFGLRELLVRIKSDQRFLYPVRRTLGTLDVARKVRSKYVYWKMC